MPATPTRWITPKDLPDDLLDVLQLPQPAARLGAVLALGQLMDADPGMALTAYQTLETLAVDDSRRVSAAAAEALSGIQVTVQPATVDLGAVTVGDEAFAVFAGTRRGGRGRGAPGHLATDRGGGTHRGPWPERRSRRAGSRPGHRPDSGVRTTAVHGRLVGG